jgi:hypothetical protein
MPDFLTPQALAAGESQAIRLSLLFSIYHSPPLQRRAAPSRARCHVQVSQVVAEG